MVDLGGVASAAQWLRGGGSALYVWNAVGVVAMSLVMHAIYVFIQEDPLDQEGETGALAFSKIQVPKGFQDDYERDATFTRDSDIGEHFLPALPSPEVLSNLIRRRRSIFPKDFVKSAEKVPVNIIAEILAAAEWAPTHGKTQPWRFCVAGKATMKELFEIRKAHAAKQFAGDAEKLEKSNKKMARKAKELQNVSAVIFIGMKRVANAKGRLMEEWEEIAAVACAVQNMHLQLTAHWNSGYCGYWSSGGWNSWLLDPRARDIIGLNGSEQGEDDKILGAFYLGKAELKKINGYRASRSGMADKIKWAY